MKPQKGNRDLWHGFVEEMYLDSALEEKVFHLLINNVPLAAIFAEMKSDGVAQLIEEKHRGKTQKKVHRKQHKSNRSLEEEVWHQLIEQMHGDYDYETALFKTLKTVSLNEITEYFILEEMRQCMEKLKEMK